MVRQVKIASILMIVNGVLITLLAVAVAALGPFLVMFDKGKSQGPNDKTEAAVLTGVFAACAMPALGCGVLQVISGFRCLRFKGRTLALVSLFGNVFVFFILGLCSMPSIAMMIYGLVV